jgi:MULE transposase domain
MSAFEEILSNSYSSFTTLEQAAQDAAKRDGFMIIKKSTEYSSDRVMMGGCIRCYKSGKRHGDIRASAKTECPFYAWYRRHPATGVYFFNSNHKMTHNHVMDMDSTTMSAVARRFIPTQVELITRMRSLQVPVPLILEELSKTTDIMFNNKDVYNCLQRSKKMEIDGLSEVQQLLREVRNNPDFVCQAGKGHENRLSWFTFANRQAMERYQSLNFVLLMDSTYKTNRFNMPLLIISAVNPFGTSYIIACCLMQNETAESYEFALQSFVQLFEPLTVEVSTIITDQDFSLKKAIEVVFPKAAHQLCWWHLEANVRKNFATNADLCSQFSRFMYAPTVDEAETLFVDMYKEGSLREKAYLKRLYDIKDKFVLAWISCNRNMGIRSTQRAESINHVFKKTLHKTNAPLVELFDVFVDMAEKHEKDQRFMEFQLRDKLLIVHPLISSVARQIPKFILGKVQEECEASEAKTIEDIDGEWIVFNDSHRLLLGSGSRCDCPFFVQFVAPCAHAFKVCGEGAVGMFHAGWKVHHTPSAQSAIMPGPRRTVRVSEDEGRLARLSALSSEFENHIHAVDQDTRAEFYEKFNDMLRRQSLDPPPEIQNPVVVKPRGRPRKPPKNNFRGGQNVE